MITVKPQKPKASVSHSTGWVIAPALIISMLEANTLTSTSTLEADAPTTTPSAGDEDISSTSSKGDGDIDMKSGKKVAQDSSAAQEGTMNLAQPGDATGSG
jgi:hypothetical protein